MSPYGLTYDVEEPPAVGIDGALVSGEAFVAVDPITADGVVASLAEVSRQRPTPTRATLPERM